MNKIKKIKNSFLLSKAQILQFEQLLPLYEHWNSQINVVSRRDIANLYERHVLHSLAIAKIIQFNAGAYILDLGTGGGFPGIPLSILFPEVSFMLIDGTNKKIKVVKEVIEALQLQNVQARQIRAEELKGIKFDFVVTRAVATLDKLLLWSRPLLKRDHHHAIPNGLLALKGGNLRAEIKSLPKGEYVEQYAIADFFDDESFDQKYVVYVQA